MVVGRRPPKMMAEMSTPSGSSQVGSMVGHCAAGAVKRPFGMGGRSCARVLLVATPYQGLPRQSSASAGGVSVMPSHQMSPLGTPFSVTSATLVKMELARRVAMALGLVLSVVPGATPKKPDSGLMARSWPVRPA